MQGKKDLADEFPDEQSAGADRNEMEQLLFAGSLKRPETGTVVTGCVIQIGPEDVFVDIGGKSDAVIDRQELVDGEGNLELQIGDTIEASVVSTTDVIRLSRRLLRSAKARDSLLDAFQSGIPVEGKIEEVRKGGFGVRLAGGTRAFCPLSQLDERRIENAPEWIGRTLEFRIMECDPKLRNVVVSRRRLLEETAARRAEEARAQIADGAVMKGRVVSLKGYGAFIDLGGVQGLLHVSEISHARVSRPEEVLKPGDEVTVKVRKIDQETGKISLSMKDLLEDPWTTVSRRIQVGERRDGRVIRVAEFGAFVELEPGIEGLVHVSELAPARKGSDARKLVEPGTPMRVKVLDLDLEARRISLARVEEGEPEQDVAVEEGAFVSGRVERIEPFGVFLRLGPGVTGLIPNEELGTPAGSDTARHFPPGSTVEVQVLSIEEGGRRIRLSRARAHEREERRVIEEYEARSGGSGGGFTTLGDALRRKLGRKDRDPQ